MKTNFQFYKHFKLPIALNPLNYGNVIYNKNNIYIISVTPRTIVVINQLESFNEIKFYRDGIWLFTYKDFKTNGNSFYRILDNNKFIFENNILIKIEKTIIVIIFISLILTLLSPEYSYELSLAGIGSHIKLRRVASKYIWKDLIFNINNKIFTKILFENIFNKFWKEIEEKFTENNHMFILFKVKYSNKEFSFIGKIQRINKNEAIWYIKHVLENMKFKSEYYNETPIESFVFSYGFKDGLTPSKEIVNTELKLQNFKNTNLPISMNPNDYGTIIIQNELNYIIQDNQGQTINLSKYDDHNEVEFFRNGVSLIKFTDTFISKNKFMRIIDNKKYWFENNKEILFTSEMKTKFISKTMPAKKLVNNFITLDIETFVHNNTLTPYLICYYDGRNSYSYWLGNYPNVEQMILDCLSSILIRKYNGFSIYMHNMAKFDIIFLLKYLVKIGNLQPVIHNGRIISLTLNYGADNKYKLEIKDSYLLLLSSLDNLSKAFKVDNPKALFPFLFVNKDNLDYIGEVPNIEWFGDKISKDQYLEYSNQFDNNWNLKNESIKYCNIDCISLYEILIKFSDLMFNLFNVDIQKYPTLSSLAFAIYRTKFMNEEIIPQLGGKIAENIRLSYTGGAVDMYIPVGENIKCYDVNSLYPSQMLDNDMPVGLPTYFEGDISTIDPNAFGFFYCKITTPEFLEHPIIQTRVKTESGVRTIAPLGSWYDWLFSKEIANAKLIGYEFEIIKGYTFESENIFEGYVEFLYDLRKQHPSGTALNLIAKILLNSLYGRFGMDDNFNEIKIMHKDLLNEFYNKHLDNLVDEIEIGDYVIVFYKIENNQEYEEGHNVNVAVSSAITAYARIHMSQFKNNSNINLYYTDTDSIYTDSDIDAHLIDNKQLGKLKLENICKKAIFLAPKVYCLLTESGKLITKAKGLSPEVEITMKDFENLLYKDVFIEKTQTKWFKNYLKEKLIFLMKFIH